MLLWTYLNSTREYVSQKEGNNADRSSYSLPKLSDETAAEQMFLTEMFIGRAVALANQMASY